MVAEVRIEVRRPVEYRGRDLARVERFTPPPFRVDAVGARLLRQGRLDVAGLPIGFDTRPNIPVVDVDALAARLDLSGAGAGSPAGAAAAPPASSAAVPPGSSGRPPGTPPPSGPGLGRRIWNVLSEHGKLRLGVALGSAAWIAGETFGIVPDIMGANIHSIRDTVIGFVWLAIPLYTVARIGQNIGQNKRVRSAVRWAVFSKEGAVSTLSASAVGGLAAVAGNAHSLLIGLGTYVIIRGGFALLKNAEARRKKLAAAADAARQRADAEAAAGAGAGAGAPPPSLAARLRSDDRTVIEGALDALTKGAPIPTEDAGKDELDAALRSVGPRFPDLATEAQTQANKIT